MMGPRCLLTLLLACGSIVACTTTHVTGPANVEHGAPQRLMPQQAWRVVEAGETIGFVVRFADPVTPARCLYSVRNELQQELGTIDELGRASRFVPHQREMQWVCTSTLTQGTASLLGASAEASLEAVELGQLSPEIDAAR